MSMAYFDEVLDLMNDLILRQMELEMDIRENYDLYDTHDFTMAVNREYQKRGGNRFKSIGGPSWALRELHTFRQGGGQL